MLIMAARSSALGGRGQNRVSARCACLVVSLVAGADLRACVRLTLRSAGAGPRIPMRLCLRDELPAVPGRSYWRVVFDFVAFFGHLSAGEWMAGELPGVEPGRPGGVHRAR